MSWPDPRAQGTGFVFANEPVHRLRGVAKRVKQALT
jgi:hypothetical protein